ncbi:sugar ABC transporter substrate-binding protein [Shouchella clausii]|uniref:ABC transporter substrate-binding protein n=1 Tax=Shouchella tritolerans TaxID=2979466 RepID=UPI001B25CD39|nr:extracellular solute-binding protein [Shouchella tritolerans]GIN13714.1 sugar ABC transporter substrate-binding protein [Shouchella clausii]
MKRLFFFFSVSLLVCSSCQFAPMSGETKPVITLWYWNRSLSDNVIAKAQEAFPHVTIDAQKIGGDEYKTKLHTALIAGRGPDIVAMNDWAYEYIAYAEEFVNLLDYGADQLEQEYLDWKWQAVQDPETGALIALPIDTGPTALYYRADLFEEAGLPTEPDEVHAQLQTWDDYIEAGIQMKEKTGVHMFESITKPYLQVIEQQSDKYFAEDGTYIGDGEAIQYAWNTAVRIHEEGLSARLTEGQEVNAALNGGDVASRVGAVWESQILQDAAPDTAGKWRVTRAPGGDGNNGGSFIGVLDSSAHKDEAVAITKWLVSSDAQLDHFLDVNLFPSAIETLESELLREPDPFYGDQVVADVFVESAKNVPPTFYGEHYGKFRAIFNDEMVLIDRANKNPEKAWEDAQKKAQRELSRIDQ